MDAAGSCKYGLCAFGSVKFVEWLTILFIVWGKWPWKINVRKKKTCLVSVMCSVPTIHIPSMLSCLRHLLFSLPEPARSAMFLHLRFQVFLHRHFQLSHSHLPSSSLPGILPSSLPAPPSSPSSSIPPLKTWLVVPKS